MYTFERYDVLQVSYSGGPWLDYATIRDSADAAAALEFCAGTHWQLRCYPLNTTSPQFRIVRGGRDTIVYPTA